MTGPGDRAPLPEARTRPTDDPPPFWGRWSRIYLVIAGLLLAEAGAFYALTRWAS